MVGHPETRTPMITAIPRSLARAGIGLTILSLLALPLGASAADKIRIGFLYDLTGPFAGAGARPAKVGTEIAVEMINAKGGVLGKYPVEAVFGDPQSSADVAINEAERLLNSEKVDLLAGVYSSAHAVPLAGRIDSQKKFFWITVAISSAVFKDQNRTYVFRPQVHGDQFGELSVRFLSEVSEKRLGIPPAQLKLAILYEDGPYGSNVAAANETAAKTHGMQIVLREGYSATLPDLSSLVIKLKRARPDVILHTGYNPDITLFLRQAKELGLRFKALIGHGAGYAQLDKLLETFGPDIDYVFNVDPVPAQLLDPKTLAPGLGELAQRMVERYRAITGAQDVPSHVSMGFNNTWILLTELLPVAINKYGGWNPEALRKAALDLDIPAGGTIQGYGVKFAPPGHSMAGQNLRASPVVMQYVKGKVYIAYPTALRTIDPVIPLPPDSPYAAR